MHGATKAENVASWILLDFFEGVQNVNVMGPQILVFFVYIYIHRGSGISGPKVVWGDFLCLCGWILFLKVLI